MLKCTHGRAKLQMDLGATGNKVLSWMDNWYYYFYAFKC